MLDSVDAGNISAVRDHTRDLIAEAFDSTEPTLIEAPPSSGKTTSTHELATKAETPVTYLCSRTDLYTEATEYFNQEADARPHFDDGSETAATSEEEAGTTYALIPSPHRDCPSFQEGTPGDETKIAKLYAKGYSGRQLHYLDSDTIATPCGSNCQYIQKIDEIDEAVESIDILIGHHTHSHNNSYIRDRIVVLDEFNADAFLTGYPDPSTETTDDPRETIPAFLDSLAGIDSSFPTNTFRDITDILTKRNTHEDTEAVIEWFRSHGVSRDDAEEYGFLSETLFEHDNTHLLAPFLTFSLFCMQRVGNEIELAPHSDQATLELWKDVGLNPSTRVVRDRNTGEMNVLRPPDLSQAHQVIGLDGLPTPELWNLFLPPEREFAHQQVLEKSDVMAYLQTGLNMSLIQIGNGMHHYAGGRISPLDEDRLRAITALENTRFPLISTKKALDVFNDYDVLDKYVAETAEHEDHETNFEYESLLARNFASVKSSNEFSEEDLGVILGTPFPGNDVVRRWAGLCGESVEVAKKGDEKTFGEFGDQIYHHLTHNQVVQAILRFGRDESVYEQDGAQVYVSTKALPEWFEIDEDLTLCTKEKKLLAVIGELLTTAQRAEKPVARYRTVSTLTDAIINSDSNAVDDISKHHVRGSLETMVESGFATVERDQGKRGADIYQWSPEKTAIQIEGKYVIFGQKIYVV